MSCTFSSVAQCIKIGLVLPTQSQSDLVNPSQIKQQMHHTFTKYPELINKSASFFNNDN